jgi:anaerobic selenocysteine-containing dehydrogenase
VVVDPRRSETAAIADRHLPIRPGADAYFLLSLIHVLFAESLVRLRHLAPFTRGVDELRAIAADFPPEATAAATGIAADAVRAVAREFTAAERAVCYGRIGTCTQEFGALASWLVDCVNALTGNLDREGGACFPRGAASPKDDTPRKKGTYPYARWRSRVRGLPEFAGELPAACLAEEIDTPGPDGERVRALVTVAGNPVLSTPNGARLARALAGLEFMVSVDIYVNETTRFADVILPPAGVLERSNYDLAFNAVSVRNYARWSPVVFEPETGARQQWEILAEIAGRVNGATAEAVDELMAGGLARATGQTPRADLVGPERLLDLMLRGGPYEGLSLEKLQSEKHGLDLGPLSGGRLPRLLATESGALELAPPLLVGDVARLRARLPERSRPDGLVLIGRRHLRSNNSWMHNVHALAKGKERCTLLVHPADAARLGLSDGAPAQVRSRAGQVRVPVSVTDEMMPGVVSLPHGFGHGAPGVRLRVAADHAGASSNDLADELGIDVLSGNAILNGIPVEVSRGDVLREIEKLPRAGA